MSQKIVGKQGVIIHSQWREIGHIVTNFMKIKRQGRICYFFEKLQDCTFNKLSTFPVQPTILSTYYFIYIIIRNAFIII